ncbi:HAD hydrolase-like protein [Duganella sp. FT80W]|uniref:HAD hydrolase-like protein n=1 Tax=Duganella guangzhouensis TaxID=2666084 RepID=A0A6I2KT27_9BURK|nr:HAD hydrolase-like protein [Duganella guangzhouensis]MRW88711.1 HAD hydrolase-like protein [Duganella guangzhouensis]
MKHQLIIFDFDGTLADTMPVFLRLFDEAADKYHFKRLDHEQRHLLRGLDARQIMALHKIPLWKVPMIASFMRSRMADRLDEIRLFPGVDDMLRVLSQRGVRLALVSSNSLSNVVATLGPDNEALFSHFECGASLFGKLPKVRKVLAAAGVAPEHTLMVGDEIRDAKVAAEAGADFGAVAWGYNLIETLMAERPARVFHEIGELALGG